MWALVNGRLWDGLVDSPRGYTHQSCPAAPAVLVDLSATAFAARPSHGGR